MPTFQFSQRCSYFDQFTITMASSVFNPLMTWTPAGVNLIGPRRITGSHGPPYQHTGTSVTLAGRHGRHVEILLTAVHHWLAELHADEQANYHTTQIASGKT